MRGGGPDFPAVWSGGGAALPPAEVFVRIFKTAGVWNVAEETVGPEGCPFLPETALLVRAVRLHLPVIQGIRL